jgi:hypothetical protein
VSDQVFDEEIALRRFQVALKRADWRLFEQALERLGEEIAAQAPFSRHRAWQDFARAANERQDLADDLKVRLREAMGRLLSVQSRSAPLVVGAPVVEETGVVLVVGWQSGLQDAAVLAAFRRWLTEGANPHGAPAARRILLGWLDEGLGLAAIAHRANLSLAAAGVGLTLADAPWVDTFFAGLVVALETQEFPPLTRLSEALAGVGPACLIVAEPGSVWERFYTDTSLQVGVGLTGQDTVELIKLGGSLDLYACARCHQTCQGGRNGPRALAVVCPACSEPASPLVTPLDWPHYAPPASRAVWEQAAERLRRAGTWVLVDPPLPADDVLVAWLTGLLSPGKRLLVVAGSGNSDGLETWQDYLAPYEPRMMVTSLGPADEVLGFLLQGGVPGFAQEGLPTAANASKKKARR